MSFCCFCTVKKKRSAYFHLSFSEWSFAGHFPFTNATCLTEHFIRLSLVDGHFCYWVCTKFCMKSPFYYNHRFRFLIPDTHLAAVLASLVKRFGNPSIAISKLDRVTYVSMLRLCFNPVFSAHEQYDIKTSTFYMFTQ